MIVTREITLVISLLVAAFAAAMTSSAADPADAVRRWRSAEQRWERDTDGPIVSLGEAGQFDDTHIFAPMVACEDDTYRLWYCGSTGRVAERVFDLGLATSRDGREFHKDGANPVYRFGDGKHSVLTPTLLRTGDGHALREDGKLRMWFASTWFEGGSGLHTLHEATSVEGVRWSSPSPPQLENVYAPSVVKIDDGYRMWFVDVSSEPWIIRHAASDDGRAWSVTDEPCVVVDQAWEKNRLFYPTVLHLNGVYLMWYGSYWSQRANTTALGFAVSADGLQWEKSPHNPVFRPDPERPWESHYVTSQSILRDADGSLRMWYASRKAPPFVNKYFAINTAVWKAPPQ
ncbi:MAG: hypothetical protein AB7U20_08315 [Planctomycetaceae bacterium]